MRSTIEFHANGKLLLSGEYLVLAGARALALPVRFGQCMTISEVSGDNIVWESSDINGTWFNAVFDPVTLKIIDTSEIIIASPLKTLLQSARLLNHGFLMDTKGCKVSVTANYPLEWGMGSSSTLCSLVADWAGVPVFDLFRMVSRGSGYDVACARRANLLFYQLKEGKPDIRETHPGKALRENSWFAWLGKKQDSAAEVYSFIETKTWSHSNVMTISGLSSAICDAGTAEELISLVKEHEHIMRKILDRQSIGHDFPGFPGCVKSLGAWGGDFAMFVSGLERETIIRQLQQQGLSTVFSYNDLVIR